MSEKSLSSLRLGFKFVLNFSIYYSGLAKCHHLIIG